MLLKDIKLIFHEKRIVFLIIVLVAVTVIATIFGSKNTVSPKIQLGVADMDKSEYTALMLSYFRESETFSSYITIVEGSEAELKRNFDEGKLDMFFVIPEGFTENLMVINNVPMKVTVNSADPTKAVVYKNLLESYSRYITAVELNCQSLYDIMQSEGYSENEVDDVNVAISYELLFTALGKDAFFDVEPIERFEGISFVNYYVYSAIMLILMYVGMFAGLSFLREKLSNANLRLRSIGPGRCRMVLSKATAYLIVCGAGILAVLLTVNATDAFEITAGKTVIILLAVFVSCLVFILIGSVFDTVGGYIVFANMLILLLTIVGGGIIPVMYLPEAMARVAEFTPNYWFIRMLL